MICQDVTITLILDDMTPEEYQNKIRSLKSFDTNPDLTTNTYDPHKPWEDLTKEQRDLVESLQ